MIRKHDLCRRIRVSNKISRNRLTYTILQNPKTFNLPPNFKSSNILRIQNPLEIFQNRGTKPTPKKTEQKNAILRRLLGSDVNVSILRFQRFGSFVLRFQRTPKTVSNRWKFMRMIIQRLPSRHDNDNNDDGNDLAGITRAGKECTCSCGLILQDGQNYVYLRHVCTERERQTESLKLSSCQAPTDPNRVIIESLPRDSGRRRV